MSGRGQQTDYAHGREATQSEQQRSAGSEGEEVHGRILLLPL